MKNLISKIYEKVKKPVLIGASALTFAVMPYIPACSSQPVYRTAEEIQQEDRRFNEASRMAGGFLFGMAGAGALDSPDLTAQQNLAVRGAASGMQQYQMNDAIRNSGQDDNKLSFRDSRCYNHFFNNDTQKAELITLCEESLFCDNYLKTKVMNGDFPKTGYIIEQVQNKNIIRRVLIVTVPNENGGKSFYIKELGPDEKIEIIH